MIAHRLVLAVAHVIFGAVDQQAVSGQGEDALDDVKNIGRVRHRQTVLFQEFPVGRKDRTAVQLVIVGHDQAISDSDLDQASELARPLALAPDRLNVFPGLIEDDDPAVAHVGDVVATVVTTDKCEGPVQQRLRICFILVEPDLFFECEELTGILRDVGSNRDRHSVLDKG